MSWTPGTGSTPDTIVINVPPLATNAAANLAPNATFRPGPNQLTITTANANGGVSSVNALTLHVLGTNGTTALSDARRRRWPINSWVAISPEEGASSPNEMLLASCVACDVR